MKQITINEFEFTIPTSYQELNKKQLLLVGELIANNTAENQLKVLYTLLGLNKWTWKTRKHWKLILTLDSVWLHTLLTNVDLLGWIWSNTQIKEYRIKSFWYKGIKYHGPNGNILNTNASEIVFGYKFYKNYSIDQKEAFLNRLIALLYRPYNPLSILKQFTYGYTGDVRMPLNGYFFNKRIDRLSKMPKALKTIIFLQFASAWDEFQNREANKLIFPKVQMDTKGKEDPMAWEKIMLRMAESGVFGTYNEVEKMDKDRFFMNMARNIEEYLAVKDSHKKQ